MARSHHKKVNCYSLSTSIASNKKVHNGHEIRLQLGCSSCIFVEDFNIFRLSISSGKLGSSAGLEKSELEGHLKAAFLMNLYLRGACNAPIEFFGTFFYV